MEKMRYKILSSLITFIFIMSVGVFSYYILNWLLPNLNSNDKKIVNVNVNDNLSISTTTKTNFTKDLISKPYISSNDVLSNVEVYDKEVINLAIYGKFSVAQLHIKGTISNNLLNFLFISIGNISGTYGVDRISNDQLSYDESYVYTKDKNIDVYLDLLSPTKLSATSKEKEQGFASSKSPILWNTILPPPEDGSIAKILITTYNQNGKYSEGSQIDKIEFVFSCVEGSKCGVEICEPNELDPGSKCIKNHFGEEAYKSYGDYFKK